MGLVLAPEGETRADSPIGWLLVSHPEELRWVPALSFEGITTETEDSAGQEDREHGGRSPEVRRTHRCRRTLPDCPCLLLAHACTLTRPNRLKRTPAYPCAWLDPTAERAPGRRPAPPALPRQPAREASARTAALAAPS
jgi:hypothetical protein